VEEFGNFCFHAVVAGNDERDVLELLRESAGSVAYQDNPVAMVSESVGKKITPTDFNVAYSSIEQVSFQDVVELFDANRKRTRLETWFTPPEVNKYVFRDTAMYEKSEASLEMSEVCIAEGEEQHVPNSLEARKRMILTNSTRTAVLQKKADEVDGILQEHFQTLRMLEQRVQLQDVRPEDIPNECKDGERMMIRSLRQDTADLQAKVAEIDRRLSKVFAAFAPAHAGSTNPQLCVLSQICSPNEHLANQSSLAVDR